MSRSKRAVVFDLDGTLVDSLPLVLKAFAHAIEPYAPRPEMEIFARLGGPPERVFHTLLGGPRHVPEAIERLEDYNRRNGHKVALFDGVPATLGSMRSAGVRLAIWTGRDRDTTQLIVERLELGPFFEVIVCGDDFATHKPDPEGLRDILGRLGAKPEETILAGDADVDILGGAACGVESILITHGRGVEAAVAKQAWRVVESPGEAFGLILGRL